MAKPGALERGHVKAKLVRELAKGERSTTQLAADFDVSRQAVDQFAKRNTARILEVSKRLDDEFAGIAFADKVNRVAMLSQQIEDVTEILADPETAARAGVQYAEMARAAQSAARAISEELGQLPARTVRHEGGVSVRYVVEGVDPGALQ